MEWDFIAMMYVHLPSADYKATVMEAIKHRVSLWLLSNLSIIAEIDSPAQVENTDTNTYGR